MYLIRIMKVRISIHHLCFQTAKQILVSLLSIRKKFDTKNRDDFKELFLMREVFSHINSTNLRAKCLCSNYYTFHLGDFSAEKTSKVFLGLIKFRP